jgi:MtrB/PioB family decaheme-associated outer membrane protein
MDFARRAGAVVVALAVLVLARPASAQFQIGGFNVEGEVETGIRFFPSEPSQKEKAKWEEYRDFTEGLFLPDLRLRIFRPDESYSASIYGSKWGQQDQEFGIRAGRLGKWDFGFDWDQTPHVFSTNSRILATQPQENQFVLPTPRPPLTAYNNGRNLDEISVRWDTAKMFVSLTPTPDLELRAEYTRIKKDGERPFSMAFSSPGGNFTEILEPIDQTVHDFRLGAAFAKENWQLQFSYVFSYFNNGIGAVSADNPCFGLTAALTAANPGCGNDATGAQPTGLISTAPDSTAHTIKLSGAYNLPFWRTRVSANASYSIRLQNASFLGYSATPAQAGSLTLPSKSLDGHVGVTNANVNVTSRPLPPLTLNLKYRIFDYHDTTDDLHYPGDVVNDRTLTVGEFIAPRFNFTRQNADFDARWRFNQMLAVTAGGGWEGWHRNENRELENSGEWFAKVLMDAKPAEWLLARLTYRPSFRRVGYYNTASPARASAPEELGASTLNLGQSLLLRKFDEADRNRQQIDILLQLFATDSLTASVTGSWKDDDYYNSTYGLQHGTNWSAGFDVSWAPTERTSFTAGYVRELIFQKQQSQNRIVNTGNVVPNFADYVWLSNNNDVVDTFYLGARIAVLPGKLDWNLGVNFSTATGTIETRNPNGAPVSGTAAQNVAATAKRMPAFNDTFWQANTGVRYYIDKAWTVGVGYAFEQFTKTDWRTDTLNPFLPGVTSSIWLGNDAKNYTAHIIMATLGYRFK